MLAREIARFVIGTQFTALPPDVIAKAKGHILDTLGVLIAATAEPLMDILGGFLNDLDSGGNASILGSGRKTSATHAALINGTLAHGLDYDDSSWRMIGHPSAGVLPAVLAIGETRNSSGRDLLAAYVLGTEVSCKVGLAAEPEMYEAGWHATGVVGVLGATAASACLLHLSEDQLCTALGIAASLACGIRENFGSFTKPFHAGAAAQHGVTAALLAKHGFTASATSLEGKAGFFNNFTLGRKKTGTLSLGSPYDIVAPGFFVKPFPSCAATHTGIEAAMNLVRRHQLQAGKVKTIQVGCGPVGPIMLIHRQPKTGFEGKFSMPFVVAMAIKEGKVGLDSFRDANAADPVVRELIEKTEFGIDPQFSDRPIDEAPARLTITTNDGQVLQECIEDPIGSPTRPMNDEALLVKFTDCVQRRLARENISTAIHILDRLEDVKDVRQLIAALTPASGKPRRSRQSVGR